MGAICEGAEELGESWRAEMGDICVAAVDNDGEGVVAATNGGGGEKGAAGEGRRILKGNLDMRPQRLPFFSFFLFPGEVNAPDYLKWQVFTFFLPDFRP